MIVKLMRCDIVQSNNLFIAKKVFCFIIHERKIKSDDQSIVCMVFVPKQNKHVK